MSDFSRSCPRCRLVNPQGAIKCDCGFDFAAGRMATSKSAVGSDSASDENTTRRRRAGMLDAAVRFARLHPRAAIAFWAFAFLIVLAIARSDGSEVPREIEPPPPVSVASPVQPPPSAQPSQVEAPGEEPIENEKPRTKAERRQLEMLAREGKKLDALASKCGDMPERSSWDGMVLPVSSYLRRTLDKPDFDGCTIPSLSPSKCWVTTCRYRAVNGFGAKVLESRRFSIVRDQVVESGF